VHPNRIDTQHHLEEDRQNCRKQRPHNASAHHAQLDPRRRLILRRRKRLDFAETVDCFRFDFCEIAPKRDPTLERTYLIDYSNESGGFCEVARHNRRGQA
jgi:hypothetical protein